MTFLFVRHGLTDETKRGMKGVIGHDDSLNNTGRKQAEAAAIICSEFDPVAVYTSPFKRTTETARIIADVCKTELLVTGNLKENFVGDWSNLPLEEVKQNLLDAGMWTYSDKKFTSKPPGGESWKDVVRRTEAVLHEARTNYQQEAAVVFVSHNAAMKAMIGRLQGKEFKDWLSLMFDAGSVSGFEVDDSGGRELFISRA